MGVLAGFLILGYYSVVAGWTLEFIGEAATNSFAGKSAAEFIASFNGFVSKWYIARAAVDIGGWLPLVGFAALLVSALLTAVYMLRASGAMDALAAALAPVLGLLGIPPETAALLLVRPVSGSGALAVGSQIMEQYGPDSAVGRTAAVMLGCSETTFYTVAVYFGAAGIRRTRYTIPAALTADLAAFVAAAWAVRLCFG